MKHKVNQLHFIGIGGTGMSGIAEVLVNLGFHVSGSDQQRSAVTDRLISIGAQIFIGHQAENIGAADVIIVSSAVKEDNPEVIAGRQKKIPIVPRAQMLAELMRLRQGIAIAGTHGKTTTTSLVASIMAEGGLDPTFVIGGRLNAVAANAKLGQGDFIVVEADESDASFLCLTPVLSVITNIDSDHMETYGHDLERLYQAFIDFTNRLPFYGAVVMCLDDPGNQRVIPQISKPMISYGFSEEAQIRGDEVECDNGRMRFMAKSDNFSIPIELAIPGEHNVLNALAAIAIAYELQIDPIAIKKALSEFKGVGRRFQKYGDHYTSTGGKFTVVDDYGHHPVEINATIAAARGAFPGRRLVLAFQPHRYSRTRDCFEDFVKVLGLVDVLLLCEVYPAGELPIVAADSKSLARAIRVHGKIEPYYVEKILDLPNEINNIIKDGDVVLCMGAGSIGQSAGQIANFFSEFKNV